MADTFDQILNDRTLREPAVYPKRKVRLATIDGQSDFNAALEIVRKENPTKQ